MTDALSLVRLLSSLTSAVSDLVPDREHTPTPGSQAATDYAAFDGGDLIHFPYNQAWLALTVAADHMLVLERALTSPEASFAPWTLTRTIMEACSKARWLLGPQLDTEKRFARGMILRYRDLHDQRTFWIAAENWNPLEAKDGLSHINGRIKRVEEQVFAQGVSVDRAKQGNVKGFGGQQLPSLTDLIEQELQEAAFYRLLSGHVHGKTWAAHATTLTPSSPGSMTPHLKPVAALALSIRSIEWFARVAWLYWEAMGWELHALICVLERACDQMSAKETSRFWRLRTSD